MQCIEFIHQAKQTDPGFLKSYTITRLLHKRYASACYYKIIQP